MKRHRHDTTGTVPGWGRRLATIIWSGPIRQSESPQSWNALQVADSTSATFGKRHLLRRAARRLAIVAALIVAAAIGAVGVAHADTPNPITGTRNGSDPELIQCPTASGQWTLCLYTSQDMDSTTLPIPYGQNYYPMQYTLMFQLVPGSDPATPRNWIYKGIAASEGQLNAQGIGVRINSYHFWAPGVRYINGAYYLAVPDVIDVNNEANSSRIYLFKSTNINGINGFTFQGRILTPNWPNTGYASDPMLDGHYDPYLIYANGDNSNCGSLSLGELHHDNMLTFFATPHVVNIAGFGLSGLGSCSGVDGHPYLEGPAMYAWNEVGAPWTVPWNYIIIFAAKPSNGPPPGCDTDNEVIAYATAYTPDDDSWTYGGILMCGSDSEWTNQASVVQEVGGSRILFAYHDGGGATHSRKTHLQCLKWQGNSPESIPRSATNLSNC